MDRTTGTYERIALAGEQVSAFVPPPPHALGEVLYAFERYMHADDALPPLVRAGLLHVQFETIHPS
ncbi:MAG: Fic family protein [Planctomycetes bacterium]|nr:Fic family protein [Planctomycetota bacterium]